MDTTYNSGTSGEKQLGKELPGEMEILDIDDPRVTQEQRDRFLNAIRRLDEGQGISLDELMFIGEPETKIKASVLWQYPLSDMLY